MENNYILDVDDEVHMFCLNYIFLPRINTSLKMFAAAWNNHPLSSEGNLSPNQLWIAGLARSHIQDDQITEVQCN